MAIADAIEAGEIAAGFGGGDDVVGSDAVIGHGEIDIDDDGAGGLQGAAGFIEDAGDIGVIGRRAGLGGNTDGEAGDGALCRVGE